jgi:hypothetical protein
VIQKHNELRFRSDLFLSSADEMMDISTEQKKFNLCMDQIRYKKKTKKKKKKEEGR